MALKIKNIAILLENISYNHDKSPRDIKINNYNAKINIRKWKYVNLKYFGGKFYLEILNK